MLSRNRHGIAPEENGAGPGGCCGDIQAFRTFVVTQSSRNVGNACIFTALSMFFSFFKAISSAGATPMSVLVAALPVCAYAAAAVAMKWRPMGQEAYIMGILCFRAAYGISTSAGILPITPWVKYCLQLHMDKLTEILTSGLLEPAPLSFLVPVRIMLGIAFGGIYKQVGMPHPRLQGALVHAAGLLVGALVDWHYRCLYQAYKARHQSRDKAALAEGTPLGVSKSKALLCERPSLGPSEAKPAPTVAVVRESEGLDTTAAKSASAVAVVGEPPDAVLGSAGITAYAQAGTGQSRTPQALAAQLAQSLPPRESCSAHQNRRQQRSMYSGPRHWASRYKPKYPQRDRVAILLQGNISPSDLPADAGETLARKIEDRLGAKSVTGMAIRAGCVVVCFDVCRLATDRQQQGRDIQEVRMSMLEAAQEWRQEMGLDPSGREGGEAPISVLSTDSVAATSCSIEARCLILVMPPKTHYHSEQQHVQQQQGGLTLAPRSTSASIASASANPVSVNKRETAMMVHLPLVVDITAPTDLGAVRGWRGPADNPEELEDKESSLCLLAAVQGRFLPLDILRFEGTRAELSIQIPADLAAAITSSTSAEVELWAGGKLACSTQVLLVPASRALVAAELDIWSQELPAEEAAIFVKDLAHWLHLRQTCCSTTSNKAPHAPFVQSLAAVGKSLLLHSLSCGMVSTAGMLLDLLVQPPLGLTFAALASEAFAYQPELTGDLSHEPEHADSDAEGPLIAAQDLVAAAQHSGCTAVLEQCQAWEAQQAGVNPTSHDPAPTRFTALMLSQWVGKALPISRLMCWARTKMAAAFPALLSGSRSSSNEGAAERAKRAAEMREYRAWVIDQNAMPTKAYFMFAPTHLSILLLRSAREHQLETDAPALALLLSFYLFIALGVHKYPKRTEAFAIVAYLGRLITLLSLGSGLLPIPYSFSAVYKCRTEAILEVFFVSCMEQIRIPWLITLRIILVGGYTILYARSGFTHPLLEALGVNGASLLVSMVMDRRHRSLYAWHRANTDGAAARTPASAMEPAAGCRSGRQHIKSVDLAPVAGCRSERQHAKSVDFVR